jgi:hypothetical protein
MVDYSQMIFQFLVALIGVDPLVWRRIQVPGGYSFWDLHVAIQDAMGWQDYHLHEFSVYDPQGGKRIRIGIPDDDIPFGEDVLPDYLTAISAYFSYRLRDPTALYTYDFGDGWRHVLAFEGIVTRDEALDYPRCISGRMKCPPEDCGGPGGYANFLEAISDQEHDEHEMLLAWIGGHFDPTDFDPLQIQFDDPGERWELAFG